jgi:leader peptidase (prepilin peptidase)/N-methyltransferase
VIGWLKLGGKCRACKAPISPRYPIIEFITGAAFVFYYVMFFIVQIGPCAPRPTMIPHEALGSLKMLIPPMEFTQLWPIYLLYMALIAGLLAASLIDAEMFMIPIEIPWVLALLGIIVHTIIDKPSMPGALNLTPTVGALSAGGTIGLLVTLALWKVGIIPVSFPDGEPMQDLDRDAAQREIDEAKAAGKTLPPLPPVYSRRDVRLEMRKEMAFLLPPMLMAAAFYFMVTQIEPIGRWWGGLFVHHWFSGLLGALFGAMVGGFVVWIPRILGTLAFGRLAMGLGDVHLMFGVGAIIGAGCATIAFFLAPFFGIGLALYMFVTSKRRELPLGPYLSMGTAFVLLFCCPIEAYLTPGLQGLVLMIRQAFGGGGG